MLRPTASPADLPMTSCPPPIDVVVLTRGLRPSLAAALASVYRQDYAGGLRVTVLADRAARRLRLPRPPRDRDVRVETLYVRPRRAAGSTVEHVARLRNFGLGRTTAPLVTFLDDDNAWDAAHLSSLFATLVKTAAQAVHSWRRLVDRDGRETAPRRFPWLAAGPAEREAFARYRHLGVLSPRECVVRDAHTLPWRGRDHGMVDLGEWLLDRRALAATPFETTYAARDLAFRVGEDDKLLDGLRGRGLAIACSGQPTLRYRLGGFSNSPTRPW